MPRITIVSASGVKNLELAQKCEAQLIALGAEVSILNLLSLELPLYTSESDPKHDAKALLGPWFDTLHTTHGFVFLAPEYNGGIPPLMTNFIAWVSRSSKDWRVCFNEKPAVIGTFSGGGSGNILIAMRMQLSYIGINVLGRQILTHTAKPLDEGSLLSACKQLITYSQQPNL